MSGSHLPAYAGVLAARIPAPTLLRAVRPGPGQDDPVPVAVVDYGAKQVQN